ncbi:MAG: hypothetical protein ACREVR_11790 [Burkholderiales bacterium]
MAVSARLRRDIDAKLKRFCSTRGISKTEAIERGLELLIEQDRSQAHAAYLAYRHLKLVPERSAPPGKRSSDAIRTAVRAKYPG